MLPISIPVGTQCYLSPYQWVHNVTCLYTSGYTMLPVSIPVGTPCYLSQYQWVHNVTCLHSSTHIVTCPHNSAYTILPVSLAVRTKCCCLHTTSYKTELRTLPNCTVHVILTIIRDYFPKQHQQTDIGNGDTTQSPRGRSWILKYYSNALQASKS
jgi:hypothetical protein